MKTRFLSLLFVAAVAFAGCSKDDDAPANNNNNNNNTADSGSMAVMISHGFASDNFELNKEYTTGQSEKVTFTMVKYYVSNIRLKREDGTWWAQPESYYLVDASSAASAKLEIPRIPPGSYTDISYMIGVDAPRNTAGAQEGALSPSNQMFWSWNTGYIFTKLEGTSPQAAMGGSFAYHVGGFEDPNNAIRTNEHSFGSSVMVGKRHGDMPEIHLKADLKKVFDGEHTTIKVAEMPAMIHMPGEKANMVADNFHHAFSFEEVHE